MKITRCLHTAILVSDLDKAEYFYGQVLGLKKVDRVLKFPGSWYQLENYQIHLILNPDFENIRHNQEKWGRNPHLALEVTNLEKMKQKLQAYNCCFQSSASARKALFTEDPDGNIIEISQAT